MLPKKERDQRVQLICRTQTGEGLFLAPALTSSACCVQLKAVTAWRYFREGQGLSAAPAAYWGHRNQRKMIYTLMTVFKIPEKSQTTKGKVAMENWKVARFSKNVAKLSTVVTITFKHVFWLSFDKVLSTLVQGRV